MRAKNFYNFLVKGTDHIVRIDSLGKQALLPEAKDEQLQITITKLDEKLQRIVGFGDKEMESVNKNKEFYGWLKLRGSRYIPGQLPSIFFSFNDTPVVNWEWAYRNVANSEYKPYADFRFAFGQDGELNPSRGRTATVLSDLADRRCALVFPALLVLTPEVKQSQASIYSPIPSHDDLVRELRARNIV